jgi:hypothetical protein
MNHIYYYKLKMREFSGELIQKDPTTFDNSEPSIPPDTKTESNKRIDDSSWFSWLKKVSIGQYRTPLYYKKSDSWSSLFGGVVTITVVLLIAIFALVTLVPIF